MQLQEVKVKEIRRQKVYVPKSMTTNQVMEEYGLKQGAAYTARKKGFFVKNYSRLQVCVDPSKFDPDICYRIAGRVFKSNLSRDPVAISIREDLIQEAVKSMWEKSGLLKELKKIQHQLSILFRCPELHEFLLDEMETPDAIQQNHRRSRGRH